MDATRLYLAECVGVIVLPISRIIIASAYKELIDREIGNQVATRVLCRIFAKGGEIRFRVFLNMCSLLCFPLVLVVL